MSDEKVTEVKVTEDKVLSIDEIIAAPDVQYDTVDAWGGKVRIGSIDAGTMLDFVESNDGPAKRTAGLRLLIKSLVDAEGNRIGTEKHLEAFKKKDSATIDRVVTKILKLNGLDEKVKQARGNASGEAA